MDESIHISLEFIFKKPVNKTSTMFFTRGTTLLNVVYESHKFVYTAPPAVKHGFTCCRLTLHEAQKAMCETLAEKLTGGEVSLYLARAKPEKLQK